MEQQFREIARRLATLEDQIARLRAQEFSKVVPLSTYARVLSDAVNRNGGYNTTIQVTGTAGLPAKISGIWFTATYVAATANVVYGGQIYNNDFPSSPTAPIASYAAAIGDRISGGSFVSLSSDGKIGLTLLGASVPAVSSIIIDVWAYLI